MLAREMPSFRAAAATDSPSPRASRTVAGAIWSRGRPSGRRGRLRPHVGQRSPGSGDFAEVPVAGSLAGIAERRRRRELRLIAATSPCRFVGRGRTYPNGGYGW